ncbi:hypothetical protein ACJX0J_031877, partial [Zea mays]
WVLMPKIQLVSCSEIIVEGYDSCSRLEGYRLLLLGFNDILLFICLFLLDTIIPYIFVRKEAGIVCLTVVCHLKS